MAASADIAERHSQMLSEFAELAFELAKDLQARALTAEDAESAGRLAKDFHLVGRSLRQTLALHARLQREQLAAAEAAETRAAQARAQVREVAVIKRKLEVGKAAERLVWDEYEPDEADFIGAMLPDLVDDLAEAADFLDAPLETLVARIRQILAEDGDLLHEPPDEPEPQSSA